MDMPDVSSPVVCMQAQQRVRLGAPSLQLRALRLAAAQTAPKVPHTGRVVPAPPEPLAARQATAGAQAASAATHTDTEAGSRGGGGDEELGSTTISSGAIRSPPRGGTSAGRGRGRGRGRGVDKGHGSGSGKGCGRGRGRGRDSSASGGKAGGLGGDGKGRSRGRRGGHKRKRVPTTNAEVKDCPKYKVDGVTIEKHAGAGQHTPNAQALWPPRTEFWLRLRPQLRRTDAVCDVDVLSCHNRARGLVCKRGVWAHQTVIVQCLILLTHMHPSCGCAGAAAHSACDQSQSALCQCRHRSSCCCRQ